MEATSPTLPAAFEELVRDALLHLYDPGHLHTHPLLSYLLNGQAEALPRGKALRQELLDAIEALRPGPGVPAVSRAWRAYHILELRYIEGHDVVDVIDQVALSKSQYHREHQRALQAVASLLWEKWEVGPPLLNSAPVPAPPPSETLARTEAQHLLHDVGVSSIDVKAVAEGVVRLLQPLCAQRRVEVRLSIAEGLPGLWGDRVALRHALLTVLTQATHRAEGRHLQLNASSLGRRIELVLSGKLVGRDEAPPWDLAESLPFVEALGGQLTYLPAASVQAWQIRMTFPVDDRPTLLVVDNNVDFIRLIERYLAGQGWRLVGAPDVAQAYALATQRRPRAILLDVVIPGRDGWELLQDLKRAPATHDIPVVICSVLHEPDVAIALGAAAYLRKPISQFQLLEMLESLGTAAAVRGSAPALQSPDRPRQGAGPRA